MDTIEHEQCCHCQHVVGKVRERDTALQRAMWQAVLLRVYEGKSRNGAGTPTTAHFLFGS